MKPGIRLVSTGPETTLLKHACRNGFWQLDRSFIIEVAKLCRYEVLPVASPFDALFSIIGTALGTNPKDTLAIIHQRLAHRPDEEHMSSALLEIDEAIQVIDLFDQAKFKDAQEIEEGRILGIPVSKEHDGTCGFLQVEVTRSP